jgi:predicted ATP-grasp superfamily ATP-dependent carboligase
LTDESGAGRVLILDANQRSALAATRSLGRQGLFVVTADETVGTLAGASKFCREKGCYPSPVAHPMEFLEGVAAQCAAFKIDLLLPMTDRTVPLILQHRDRLPGVRIPFVSPSAYEAVSDKWALFQLAERLGISTPATRFAINQGDLLAAAREMAYPLVIKSCRSALPVSSPVRYATSKRELEWIAAHSPPSHDAPYLVQEFVAGRGQGIFALYDQGKALDFFAHRRLREKPPSGGVSVFSESVAVDPQMKAMAARLLDAVGWHGVAMVEFKVTSEGKPYLIEVNARFWGSLQLAIDAGVDFPWMLYKLGMGQNVEPVGGYKLGMKNRWLLGDLDHLYLLMKSNATPVVPIPFGRSLLQFLKFFEKDVRYEINRWDDLAPFLFELKSYLMRRHSQPTTDSRQT